MSRRIAAVVAVALSFAGAGRADPPTLVVRLKPAAELLPLAGLAGRMLDREAEANALAALAAFSTTAKSGLRGLDPSKPIALYLTLTDGALGTSGALMLPVRDPAAFESALASLAGIAVAPEQNGVRELRRRGSQLPGALRYRHGYAYLAVLSPTFVDDAHLVPPEVVFAGPLTAAADCTLRAGQLTPAMVAAVFAQFDLADLDAPRPPRAELDDARHKLTRELPRVLAKRALEQSDTVRAELALDAKSGRAALAVSLTPKPDTRLAAEVAGWAAREGVSFGARPAGLPPRSVVGAHLGFSDDARPYWASVVKSWLAAQLAKPRPHALRTGLALRALAAALSTGRLDLDGALLPEIDAPEVFSEAVVKLPAGAGALEALLDRSSRELALLTPGFAAELVPFGRGRALRLAPAAAGGVPTLSAFRAGRLHLARGPDALPALAALVERRPSPAAAASADVSVVELAPVFDPSLTRGKLADAAVFGPEGYAGRDRLTILLTGGGTANLTAALDARAAQTLVRASRSGAAPGPPAPAPPPTPPGRSPAAP